MNEKTRIVINKEALERFKSIAKAIEESDSDDIVTLSQIAHLDIKEDFVGSSLSGVDFSNKNLDAANFYDADLSDANFTGANLAGANLSETKIFKTIFSDAKHSEENLSNAYN